VHVALVSPERILWEGEADMVIARTTSGDIAFMNHHAPFVGVLDIGKLRIIPTEGGEDIAVAVHGGFVEVKDNRVTILSDVAELADQIDVERARASLLAATSGGVAVLSDEDAAALEAARKRALIRLDVAGAPAPA
jgi:F-type H+-transporting ATPase subunit epsilon